MQIAKLYQFINSQKKKYMNFKKWTTALMLILTVTSCIQDEALNSEAAIDACTGADVQLAHINSDSKEINIYVHKGADLSKQQLLFTLPVGATLSADKHYPNDILNNYDFSNDSHSRTFTVTSEDGEWTATYTVKIIPAEVPGIFHFARHLNQCFQRAAMVKRQSRLQTYQHDGQPHRLPHTADCRRFSWQGLETDNL